VRQATGTYESGLGPHHFRWWSADEPAWVILLAHGFGDHSGRYERYASTITAGGGAVYCPDLRGHGLSPGERAVIESFDTVAEEYLGLREAPEFPRDLPLVLAGHSMGALVISRAATMGVDLGAAGLVVSGARLGRWPAADELLASIDRGEIDPDVGGGHPLLDPRTDLPPDALSRDTSIVQQFLDDELTYRGAYPVPTLRAYLTAQRQLEEADDGAIAQPVLYMHGGDDPITPFRGSVERLANLVADDFEVRVFPGARHSIYNELNREEIFEVLVNFIRRVT